MNKRRVKRAFLLTGFIGLLLVGGYVFWLFQAQRHQYALNRQLIAALVKYDTTQALSLVNEGADPNTPYRSLPAPSLEELWNHLFQRSAPPVNDSPTALLIACGAVPIERGVFYHSDHQPDAPQLVEAMIQHHAEIEAKDNNEDTSLHLALVTNRPKTVGVLLKYKADANSKNIFGDTPLIDGLGDPTSIVRLLLEHGADPSLPDRKGNTPLHFAQKYHLSATVALLRTYGAKK